MGKFKDATIDELATKVRALLKTKEVLETCNNLNNMKKMVDDLDEKMAKSLLKMYIIQNAK